MVNAKNPSTTIWFISRRWDLLIVVAIALLGLGLRVCGIDHAIGTHPDERHMVQVTTTLTANQMNPKSFAYGSFSFYAAWGFAQLLRPFWSQAMTYDGLFTAGRAFCIVMGTAAVALTYYLSILLYRRSFVGIVAALFLAINVFHIQLSRFFTSDVTLSTLCLISLIALVKAHQSNSLKAQLVFGACAGLATATKISSIFLFAPMALVIGVLTLKEWIPYGNWQRPLKALGITLGSLVLMVVTLKLIYWKGYPKILGYRINETAYLIPLSIPFLAGISLCIRKISQPLSHLFASISLGVLVFCVAEPYAILDFETFRRHTTEQTNMVRGYWRPPYTIQYAHTLPYIYHLQQMLWYTMGWPLFLVAMAGILVATARTVLESIDKVLRQEFLSKPLNPEIIPLTFLIVFFVATGNFQVKFPRYLLPLYPLAFIFGAALFAKTFAIRRRVAQPQLPSPAAAVSFDDKEE
jgi:4-amino-4-deoxy-L-arabinose transferase-like glycosyltransferase